MLILPILSAIFYSISNTLSKLTSNKLGVTKSIFLQSFSAALFLCIIGIFNGFGDINLKWFILTALLGFSSYIPLLFFLRGISVGKIGLLLPIKESSAVFSILFSLIFLNQKINIFTSFFVILIILSAVLISFNFKDFKSSIILDKNSGVLSVMIAAFLWSLVLFLFNFPAKEIGALNTSIIIELFVSISAFIHLTFLNKEKLSLDFNSKYIYLCFLLGVFMGLGTLFLNISLLTVGGVITFSILSMRPILGSLLAKIFFKEKLDNKQKSFLFIAVFSLIGIFVFR